MRFTISIYQSKSVYWIPVKRVTHDILVHISKGWTGCHISTYRMSRFLKISTMLVYSRCKMSSINKQQTVMFCPVLIFAHVSWFQLICMHIPFQQPFIETPNSDFICVRSTRPVIVSLSTLAGLLTLIMIAIVVIYKFRGEIKIILYFKLGCKPFDRSDDSDILDKVRK